MDDILSNYQHIVESFDLIMGSKGVFDVWVNDELVYSKKELGRHAEEGEVLRIFESLIGPDVPKYGT